jgi:hypothetical protein
MAAVYPEGIVERNVDKEDAVWFQNDMNPVATVVDNGKEASIFVTGDVRILIDDSQYRNVLDIISLGITNDIELEAAEERGDIEFYNNNWFEIIDPATDDVTGLIAHTISEAVEKATNYVLEVSA